MPSSAVPETLAITCFIPTDLAVRGSLEDFARQNVGPLPHNPD